MLSAPRALITGSSRGVGLAVAEELIHRGYAVVLNYAHDETTAMHAVEHLRQVDSDVAAVRADVTDERAVARLVAEVLSGGPIDLLVNNVGDFLFKPFVETTATEWDGILRSNLTSAALCCRAVLPSMRARTAGQIVNVASMNAGVLRAKPNTLPYAIANAGVVLLTKTLAVTEGRFGIRVNAVSPGFVATGDYPPQDARRQIPLGRAAFASEIAKTIAFLASDEASYVTGAVLDVHGGAFL